MPPEGLLAAIMEPITLGAMTTLAFVALALIWNLGLWIYDTAVRLRRAKP